MASSSSSLMASQTLILPNPKFLPPRTSIFSLSLSLSNPRTIPSLSLSTPKKARVFASSTPNPIEPIPTESPLTDSSRPVAEIAAIAVTVANLLAQKLSTFAGKLRLICSSPNPDELLAINHIQDTVMCTVGPLFFAAISTTMSTPLTVVLAGIGKWLSIYNGVLMIRIMLSWFPNVPWERQPFLVIRDVCDPYLTIFRNIIPPLFNALDISPIFALTVLGFLAGMCRVPAAPL